MTSPSGGLSLHDAARAMGVVFNTDASPTEREVRVNGARLHYLDWGNEGMPPLVLLHGRTNSAHTWDFTSLAFHESHHVIALNQRGHGESDWSPDGNYSLDRSIPDIEAFIQDLGLASVRLIGHSMGGRVAMAYASQHPENVTALVVVDIAPHVERSELDTIRGWNRLPRDADSLEEFVEAAHALNPRRTKEQLRGSLSHQLRQYPNGKWSWKWDPALREADTTGWTEEHLWESAGEIRCPFLLDRGG